MRGARTVTVGVGSPFRIIPADAGSTFFIGDLIWRTPDHPRGCGEHILSTGRHVGNIGSSPRMRGAPDITDNANNAVRIIPADAGSTFCLVEHKTTVWDHPRGCGEHNLFIEFGT